MTANVPDGSNYTNIHVALNVESDGALRATWHFPNGKTAWGNRIQTDELRSSLCDAWGQHVSDRGIASASQPAAAETRPPGTRDVGSVWRDIAAVSRSNTPDAIQTIEEFLEEVGTTLYCHVCSDDVRAHWNEWANYHTGTPIRVILDLNRRAAVRLADIPFEAIACQSPVEMSGVAGSLVLAPQVSLVRRVAPEPGIASLSILDVEPPLKVLVIASNPRDLPPERSLDVEKEKKEISCAVKNVPEIDLEFGEPTFEYFRSEAPKYHVVHFTGHGDVDAKGGAQILFEDPAGLSDFRSGADVTGTLLRGLTRLLVLNGCRTAAISVFASQLPSVVGMQIPISDESGTLFARALYAELADSGELDAALRRARETIHDAGEKLRWEYRTPVLYIQTEEGLLVRLRPKVTTASPLPRGEVGKEYSAVVEARCGRRPFRWQAQNLPPGLAMGRADGVIAGRPEAAGVFDVTVQVSSRDGLSASRSLELKVAAGNDDGPVDIITDAIG